MAKPRVETDTAAFERGLKQTLQRFERDAETEVNASGDVARARMTQQVAVKTGRTKSSIRMISGRDRSGPYVELLVGGAAVVLEFGTSKMAPRPFIRNALAEAAARLR